MAYSPESPQSPSDPERRRLRTQDGALFVTAVSKQLTHDLWLEPQAPLPDSIEPNASFFGDGVWLAADIVEKEPSSSALCAATAAHWQAQKSVKGPMLSKKRQAFDTKYGVTDRDYVKYNGIMAGSGLADSDFSWHFAPVLASAVTQRMVQDGVISRAEQHNLNLHDWANVIGSGWFSSLLHNMAYTIFGTYARFGTRHIDYQPGKLEEHLSLMYLHPLGFTKEPFAFAETDEPADGYTYKTAKLSDNCHNSLRRLMRKQRVDGVPVTGCPAARYNFVLDVEVADTDPHILHLKDQRQLICSDADDRGRVQLSQEYTAIDHALAAQASLLDRYADTYGNPYLHYDERRDRIRVRHEHASETTALRYPTPGNH